MRSWPSRFLPLCLVTALVTAAASIDAATPPDWSRFRGPNGSGISTATSVPTEFGPAKNLLWRLPLPQGHSSPILHGDRIYLTAFRGNALVTMAIDRVKGKILWERAAPEVKTKVVDKRNNPASPSPAVEAEWRLRLLSRLRPHRLRRGGQASCGRCRSGRSTTSTAWARRR